MKGVQISTILTQQDHQKLSITKMKHPLLDRWVRVLSSITPPGKPIPNINTVTRANMSVTLQEKLRELDPELFQSILATPIEEIDDSRIQAHLYDQKFWTEDEDQLRHYGYEKFANTIRDEKKKFEQDKINKQIEESRQRQAIQQKERERRANMSLIERLHEESLTQTPADIINNQLKYHGRVGTN